MACPPKYDHLSRVVLPHGRLSRGAVLVPVEMETPDYSSAEVNY